MCVLINTEISECGLQEILVSDVSLLFKNIDDVKSFIGLEFYDKAKEKDTLELILDKFTKMQWYEACKLVKTKINNL